MATITASVAGGKWEEKPAWVGEVVPTAADDVILAATSGSITVSVEGKCRSLDATSYAKTLKLDSALKIGTSSSNAGLACKLGTLMTLSGGNNTLEFLSTSGEVEKITMAGREPRNFVFNGVGGKWQFEDQVKSSESLEGKNGELKTNGQEVVLENRLILNNGVGAFTVSLGASIVKAKGSVELAVAAKLTWEAGTSTIEMTGANATLIGAGQTFNIVKIAAEGIKVKGSNTYATLELAVQNNANSLQFEGTTTHTCTTFVVTGVAGKPTRIASTSLTEQWKLKVAGGVSVDFVQIKDCKAEGATPFNAGYHSMNRGNNSGWLFPSEEAAAPYAPGGSLPTDSFR